MSDNPYQSPQSPDIAIPPGAALGELVKSWERNRLLYNIILLVPGIVAMSFVVRWSGIDGFWAVLIALGLGAGANVAFFAGPLAELYLRALFFGSRPTPILRRVIFTGGIGISLVAMALFAADVWLQMMSAGH